MKTQLELNVVTELNLSLIAKLLLLINRKQIELTRMRVSTNFLQGNYKYQLLLSGKSKMLDQVPKVIAKQIGVMDVRITSPELLPRLEREYV